MSTAVRRPGVVTFIGIVLYIQAFLALVGAIVLLAFSGRIGEVLAEVSTVTVTGGSIVVAAVGELILAVLLFLVAGGIMRGNRGYRLLVAVVEGLRMATALIAMLYYQDGAFVERGVVTIAVGIFVLWALYGNDRSDAYFERGSEQSAAARN